MRLADYLIERLVEAGIRDVFLITGGGAMHLNDAIGRNPALRYVCCHHEQACAIAAESYTRLTNRLCAVNVTTGPGGTNAISGVYGAFVDSIAMLVVSGQVKRETTVRCAAPALRQLGDQEIDIVRLVEPVTKYAELVQDPQSVRYHVEKALFLAQHGRPGPVWLDVPLDVQAMSIEPSTLRGFDPAAEGFMRCAGAGELAETCQVVARRLAEAKRPVLMVGSGVRIAGACDAMLAFAEKTGIPVVTAWNAHDLLWDSHPLYAGRPGTVGDRAGNFVVQNADFLLCVGSRLNIRQVSYAWKHFARQAYKVIVDIDPLELRKPTVEPDLPVEADAREFFDALTPRVGAQVVDPAWLAWCRQRRERYPVVLPGYWAKPAPVNPYCFVQALFRELGDEDIVVCGNGTACVVGFQAAELKRGQRLYTNSGAASMGYDLPAALGACVASGRRVVCLAGDGSLMMNVQELQTIAGMGLAVKVFVLNNRGYHSIRQTQNAHFPDGPIGFDAQTGVTLPDLERLAHGFALSFARCVAHADLAPTIRDVLERGGPTLCEIVLDTDQPFAPKLASRRLADGRMVSPSLEDMSPFLSREELQESMICPSLEA